MNVVGSDLTRCSIATSDAPQRGNDTGTVLPRVVVAGRFSVDRNQGLGRRKHFQYVQAPRTGEPIALRAAYSHGHRIRIFLSTFYFAGCYGKRS